MADVMDKTGDHLDTKYGDDMQASVSHFREFSKVKSNGIREVPKHAYVKALEKHGVTEADVKKVQHAVDFETTAAAHLALEDVETKITEASKEDLANDDFRRGIQATVRLPTFGGSTEVTMQAETISNIPFRGGEGEEPQKKIGYGRLRTSINTKGRVHVDVHTHATDRIRAALGLKD